MQHSLAVRRRYRPLLPIVIRQYAFRVCTWPRPKAERIVGQAGRGLVEHSALAYGISGSGKMMALYPSNFSPQQIAPSVLRE
jgi:hypothetical protein